MPCLRRPERNPEQLQQLSRLLVGLRGGDDRNVHAARLVDLHVVDLGEQQLILEAERVVAAAVEALGRNPAEVADARQRHRDQAVEELPHALTAQRHHRPDRHALADLELRDRLLGAGDHRLLAGDAAELVGAGVDDLRVLGGFAEAHVDHDLGDLRDRHDVVVAELLLEAGHRFLLVPFPQAAHLSTTPSHLRQIRTLRPSPRIFFPRRVGLPHSGHISCTFDACSGASRSTTPPLIWRCGFGLVWRLMKFTPSTTTRFFSGSTFSTRPCLPRSLPVLTTTLSFFRIGVASLDIFELCRARLEHLWRERNNLHEPALAQLAGDRAEYAGADRFAGVADQHRGVPVEPDVAAILAALLLAGAHDHRLDDLPLLDRPVRGGFLDRGGDDVAEPGVAAGRSADRIDRGYLPRARVVGDVQDGAHLNHGSAPLSARPAGGARDDGFLDLLRLLDHASDHPALAGAHRPGLDDRHAIADLDVVVLVVREELRGPPLRLAVELVTGLPLDRDGHRLLHLVADDHAGDFRLGGHLHSLLLAQDGLHAREVAAQRLELVRRLQLAHRFLD